VTEDDKGQFRVRLYALGSWLVYVRDAERHRGLPRRAGGSGRTGEAVRAHEPVSENQDAACGEATNASPQAASSFPSSIPVLRLVILQVIAGCGWPPPNRGGLCTIAPYRATPARKSHGPPAQLALNLRAVDRVPRSWPGRSLTYRISVRGLPSTSRSVKVKSKLVRSQRPPMLYLADRAVAPHAMDRGTVIRARAASRARSGRRRRPARLVAHQCC